MILSETKTDLFEVPQGYYLAHCISGDYALGAGIAKTFNEVYNMRNKLQNQYPYMAPTINVGKALLIDNVFNLVTKPRCYMKPTYDAIKEALYDMKMQCLNLGIIKLAMPKIACGLDRCDWDTVQNIIIEVFKDTSMQIVICELS